MREARSRLAKSSQLSGPLSKRYANGSCDASGPVDFKAPKDNVWSGLTDIEAANVTRWLFLHSGLNLTNSSKAGEWDNTLLLVELNIPNKTDVLPYINGNASAPDRWAHVTLNMRATDEPVIADILVGPLPIDNVTTTWVPLEYPYTKKSSGTIRNLDADSDTTAEFRCNISATISDITLDLWNGTALCMDNDTLSIWGIVSRTLRNTMKPNAARCESIELDQKSETVANLLPITRTQSGSTTEKSLVGSNTGTTQQKN